MDLNVKDKIALVTGSDSGIGWSTAKALYDEGATVILTDQYADELKEAAEKIGTDERIHYYVADIRQTDALTKLHEQIQEEVGKIDILVQNAGTSGAQGQFHEIDEEGWIETLDVDLISPAMVIKEFLPDMRSKGWGRIIIVSSENGMQPYSDEIPYDTAKAGLLALSKGLSKAYAKEGILVNAVSPAFIETPMTDAMMEERAEELGVSVEEAIQSFLKEKRPHIELKRRGEAEEVASVIAFLCSEKSSFVNGANYRVDGGSVASI